MVRDSKGIGHVVKEGTAIGKNSGLVYKIMEGEIVIREEFKDFRGRIQHKEIVKKSPSARRIRDGRPGECNNFPHNPCLKGCSPPHRHKDDHL